MRWLRRDEGFTSLKANGFPASALRAGAKKKAKKPKKKKTRGLKKLFGFLRRAFHRREGGRGVGLGAGGCWRPLSSAAAPVSADVGV